MELTITRHTKQAGMGIWGSVAGQASSLSLESLAPLPQGKKKNFGDFKHRSTKNLCERNELNRRLSSLLRILYALVKALELVTPLEATASPRGTRAYLKPP